MTKKELKNNFYEDHINISCNTLEERRELLLERLNNAEYLLAIHYNIKECLISSTMINHFIELHKAITQNLYNDAIHDMNTYHALLGNLLEYLYTLLYDKNVYELKDINLALSYKDVYDRYIFELEYCRNSQKSMEELINNNEISLKECSYIFFSILFDILTPYIDRIFPKNFSVRISKKALQTIKQKNNKVLWYEQIPVYVEEFENLGNIIKLPAAYLLKHGFFPESVTLHDMKNNTISLDDLEINDLNPLKYISGDKQNHKARFICKYFANILGKYPSCSKKTCEDCSSRYQYVNDVEAAYTDRFYDQLITLNKHIRFLKDDNSNKDQVLKFIRKSPTTAHFFYITKLYTLWKYANTNFKENITINQVSYDAIKSKPSRIGYNFDKVLELLFNNALTDIPHEMHDNVTFSSIIAPDSENGLIFDELFTLLTLNMEVSMQELITLSSPWTQRATADIQNFLKFTDTSLKNCCELLQKYWFMQNICLSNARARKNELLTFKIRHRHTDYKIPPHPLYFLGSAFTLHVNKHAHFFNQIKRTIINLFVEKSYAFNITFIDELKSTINSSYEAIISLFDKPLKDVGLAMDPTIHNLLSKRVKVSPKKILKEYSIIARFILQKNDITEEDLNNLSKCIDLLPIFIPSYPNSFQFTKEQIAELIYISCIGLYISYHFIYDNQETLGFTIRKKGFQKKDTDKRISKIIKFTELYSVRRRKSFYSLLRYSTTESISSGFQLHNKIFLQNFLAPFEDESIFNLTSLPQAADSPLHRTLISFFLIIIFAPLYKALNKNIRSISIDTYRINRLIDTSIFLNRLGYEDSIDCLYKDVYGPQYSPF